MYENRLSKMAEGSITPNNINFFRCTLAFLNIGTQTLRKMLESKVSQYTGINTIGLFLTDSKNKTKLMKSMSLTKIQKSLLYPVDGSNPDIDTWDITLLSNVLINACSLTSDEIQCVRQLRDLRNELYGHKAGASMDDADFDNIWTELKDVIIDILSQINNGHFTTDMLHKLHCAKTDHLQVSDETSRAIDRLFSDMEDLSGQVHTITTDVDDIKRVISSGGLQIDQSQNVLSIDDIKQFLLDKYESSNVAVAPLLNNIEDVDISDLYVEVSIHDITDKQMLHTPQSTTNHRINSYEQLFQPGSKNEQRRIILLGNAGSGKSTYCRKIIKTWRTALDKSSKGHEKLTKDEETVLEFDFVFFIPLCEVIDHINVKEMIEQLYLQQGTPALHDSILYYLQSGECKCLLIFDGLDEWNMETGKHVKGLFDFHCLTITTTRHWALGFVPKDLQKHVLEIKPMDEDNTRLLAGNVLYHFYGVPRNMLDINVGRFLNEMKQHNLMEITEIPLILTYFVCLWHEESGLDSSLTTNYGGIIENLIKYAEVRDVTRSLSHTTEESIKDMVLPGPLTSHKRCKAYSRVLYELGKFAFHNCISGSHEKIVHSSSDISQHISEEIMKPSLRIGILTSIKSEKHVTKQVRYVRFLHKSIQDFLAALWFVRSYESEIERLKSYCSELENLMSLKAVLRFICGLKPSLHNGLSTFAVGVASNSDQVQTYRHSLDNFCDHDSFRVNTYNIVKEVQELLLMTLREARLNRKYVGSKKGDSVNQYHGNVFYIDEISPVCFIQDVIMDNVTESDVNDIFQNKNLKSVLIDNLPLPSAAVKDHLLTTASLERLHLDQSISSILQLMPCSAVRFLRSLSVSMKNADCLPEHFSHIPHLSALCLCISGSHSTIESLVEYFMTTKNLVELDIELIQCDEHKRANADCKYVIDISNNKKLTTLCIGSVSKGSVLLPHNVKLIDVTLHGRMRSPDNVLFIIRGLDSLTHLTLGDLLVRRLFEWKEKDIVSVIKTIPTLTQLRYLHLMGIHFDEKGPELSLHAKRIETVYMEDVHMSSDGWKHLLHSILDIQDRAVKTSALINSSTIENNIVDFINEKFDDVSIDTKSEYSIIRFSLHRASLYNMYG